MFRGANLNATQYTFNASTRPTSRAGQLSATTSLGAANNIAIVKANLTICHTRKPMAAVIGFTDARRPLKPRANKAAGRATANAPYARDQATEGEPDRSQASKAATAPTTT